MDTLRLFSDAPPGIDAKSPLHNGTPIEKVEGWDRVWVKREDLSSPLPGPSFSKIRGVYARISRRPESTIGVLDTFHSKAGWAVSYICSILGKQCVNFYPRYKEDGDSLRPQQEMAKSFGAELHPLTAGRSAILYHRAAKEMQARGGYLMPNALKLEETVEECANEVHRTAGLKEFEHLVISVSSATIATGVMKGFQQAGLRPKVWLHKGYDRSTDSMRQYMAHYQPEGWKFPIEIIDEGYAYKDQAREGDFRTPPFPCNPYYDLKAWRWLDREGIQKMGEGRILFWNIGS